MKMTPENVDSQDCRPVRKVPGGSMTEEFRQRVRDSVKAVREAASPSDSAENTLQGPDARLSSGDAVEL